MQDLIKTADSLATILSGVEKLNDITKVTMGPKGRYIILEKEYGSPLITNDGATIAEKIKLQDRFENLGSKLVLEVAKDTNNITGDGTTTAILLTKEIIAQGIKNVVSGVNPVFIRTGLEKAAVKTVELLEQFAKKVENQAEIAQVAAISAKDQEIGHLISEIISKVGKNGVITVESSRSLQTEITTAEGLQINQGYISPYMVTDDKKNLCEFEKPYILITNKKISNIQEIIPLLEKVVPEGRPLLIIAEDIDNDVLSTLILNKMRGAFNICAVKAPGFGDDQLEDLKDLACLTNAKLVNKDFDTNLKDMSLEDLGTVKKVVISKNKATFIHDHNSEALQTRKALLEAKLDSVERGYQKEQLQKRIAKLTNGVGIIKVGSSTEAELEEKKIRIEDALNATKAAIEEGIVAGGGVALVQLVNELNMYFRDHITNEEEKIGVQIFLRSIEKPAKQIAFNSGYENSAVMVDKIKHADRNYGMNYLNNQWGNMFDQGVIDPLKVVKTSLLKAVSISALILNTNGLVVQEAKKDNNMNQ